MNLKKFFVFTVLTFAFAHLIEAHEKKWPEKRLRQAWPTALSFTSKQISLSSAQISQLNSENIKIGTEDRSPTFYFAQEKDPSSEKNKNVGIILFIDEYGANGIMEISVAMGSNGKINKVDLWEHSENSLVAKQEYLKQFVGKTSKDTFIPKKDYQPIAEATQASEAVARAVEKALKISDIIFKKK